MLVLGRNIYLFKKGERNRRLNMNRRGGIKGRGKKNKKGGYKNIRSLE